ncbi:MAG: hypothetical protein ACP5M1_01695 [Acidiphilium sp.]|jgi:hypothetical protein
MKRTLLACTIILGSLAPMLAHAAPHTTMTPQQMTAMKAKLSNAEKLVAEINQSYGTQFAIGPKNEMMAMHHMAMANMEMSKALMEMQAFWTANPSAMLFPAPKGQ